ncbi:MAG: serine/threonine protein kinase [Rhizobacter sp.]|nr:serine/threonine protein kinase [Burkholderiales bacterium]
MDTPSQQNFNQLPIGTILGDFKITGIVGEGGFGIVYLAYEAALDRTVAIKEYLPSSIAGRTGNQSVMVRSQLNTNAFTTGLKNFLREAQLLARFSHPAMVEVHRVWEQNSTAYMAMRYYDGKTLRELRQGSTHVDELYIRRLVEPILDALSLLHAQNVIHRDVSPDNILMRGNGAPVLLDLGAARLVIGGMTQALTTILKPGYAPIEQYVDDGTMRQGPWTDVYGLGAVLYYLLTSVAPPQAVARMITDPLRDTLASKVKIPVAPYFLDALAKALAVRPDDRYQSVDELRDGLQWNEPLPMEPRTTYARAEVAKLAAAAAAASASGVVTGSLHVATTQPTAAATVTLPSVAVPAPAPAAEPLERVFAQDSDATVVWQPGAQGAQTVAASIATSMAASPPPAPPSQPSLADAAMPAPRARAYGDADGAGPNKTWLFAAIAALVAAGAGYFVINQPDKPTAPVPPAVAVAPLPRPPAVLPDKPKVDTVTPPAAPVAVAASAAATASARPAVPTAQPAVDPAKAKEIARLEQVAQEASVAAKADKAEKAKRDAEEKAKAKSDAQEKIAKAKSDADERFKVRAKQDADERAEVEERARRAREEDERQAAAKARADADRQAKAAPAAGITVAPVRRTVEELSAAGKAAFNRGEVNAARAAWNELVGHPEAQARSKAITYNNLAVSYCQGGDEANCERMYLQMFRVDKAYGNEVSEREAPTFKRAYDRAARTARSLY